MFVNGVRIGRKLTTAMRKRIRQVQLAALPALFAVAVIAVVLGVAVFPTGTSIFLTSPKDLCFMGKLFQSFNSSTGWWVTCPLLFIVGKEDI